MRVPQFYATTVDPVHGNKEEEGFVCKHCQKIVTVKPFSDPVEMGGLCKCCMGLICKRCVGLGKCVPWERQMEIIEARDKARRSYGLGS